MVGDEDEAVETGFQSLETGASAEVEVAPAEKPAYLAPDPAGIPTRLMGSQQRVCWNAELRDGKWTKVPIAPATGQRADARTPETWSTCAQDLKRYRESGLDGIGYVFAADDPFTGIDLDDMNEDARAIVGELSPYTEESPSGRGVHLILEASKPGPRCRVGTPEIYVQCRFFAITGIDRAETG